MAESPAHRFGQLIGGLLEAVVRPQLEEFCQQQGLYLDHQQKTRAARRGRKVTWEDPYGNTHDLDFVVERNGTDAAIGSPVAFIEVTRVLVVPLYGRVNEFASIESAIRFLDEHRIYEGSGEFRKYEVFVEFSNGDKVQAFLDSKQRVREFLEFVSRQ